MISVGLVSAVRAATEAAARDRAEVQLVLFEGATVHRVDLEDNSGLLPPPLRTPDVGDCLQAHVTGTESGRRSAIFKWGGRIWQLKGCRKIPAQGELYLKSYYWDQPYGALCPDDRSTVVKFIERQRDHELAIRKVVPEYRDRLRAVVDYGVEHWSPLGGKRPLVALLYEVPTDVRATEIIWRLPDALLHDLAAWLGAEVGRQKMQLDYIFNVGIGSCHIGNIKLLVDGESMHCYLCDVDEYRFSEEASAFRRLFSLPWVENRCLTSRHCGSRLSAYCANPRNPNSGAPHEFDRIFQTTFLSVYRDGIR